MNLKPYYPFILMCALVGCFLLILMQPGDNAYLTDNELISVLVVAELLQVAILITTVNKIYQRVDSLVPENATSGDMLLGGFISMGLALGEKDKNGQLTERAVLARMAMDNLVGYAGDKLRERLLAGTPMQGVDVSKLPKKQQGIIGIAEAIGLKDIILQKLGKGAAKAVEKKIEGGW